MQILHCHGPVPKGPAGLPKGLLPALREVRAQGQGEMHQSEKTRLVPQPGKGYNEGNGLTGKKMKVIYMNPLPIGIDDFEKVRRGGYYYVDKTLMIRDFLEMRDEVALIARPRRFGKTLNMTMIRDFFDITKDSLDLFQGLAIMDTEYGKQINSRPVIYFTFKDCKGDTAEDVFLLVKQKIYQEER